MNRKIIYKQLLSAVLWMLSISIVTAVHASNMLEDISFASIPGDKIQVTLQFSEPAVEPGSFTIDSPARISLDFPDTGVALKNKRQAIGIGLARSITAVSAGNRTRVVLNLTSLTQYSTSVEGNKVIVTLDEANTSASTASLSHNTIENIDFRLGDEGEGNVVIYFNKQPESVSLKQQGKQLILDVKDTSLPGNLERRLDVTDFNTPVTYVDTFGKGKNTKMVVDTRGEFDHLGYQAGNTFVIEVKELSKAQKKAKDKAKFGYTGERLSLNFQDIEVRAVLQLIADFTGKNMVTSDTVTGSITLRLKNVPWDQALAIILKTKGLGMREEGNVMRVAPAEELAAIEKQELEAKKQIAELLPLVTETIQLQFVTASTVEKLLKKSRQQALYGARGRGGRGSRNTSYNTDTVNPNNPDDAEGASYFSSRGTIMSDDRTNKIIIRDTARNIAQLRKLVAEIDTPTKQVLIDARIVAASNSFNKDMGLSWNFASVGNNGVVKTRGDLTPGTTNTAQTSQGGVDLGAAQKNLLG
ncbi:MAG TPA: type IV pilus secretin family protein, partial [Gammaproteobacteria bacterium]|nr:type IV pilus secretin family protein [Gammaproteobacteria bacterium]